MVDAAAAHVRLGLGLVAPVVEAVADRERERRRHVDEDVPERVVAPRLEHQHPVGRILREPVRERAAGGPSADDHEVVVGGGHGLDLSQIRAPYVARAAAVDTVAGSPCGQGRCMSSPSQGRRLGLAVAFGFACAAAVTTNAFRRRAAGPDRRLHGRGRRGATSLRARVHARRQRRQRRPHQPAAVTPAAADRHAERAPHAADLGAEAARLRSRRLHADLQRLRVAAEQDRDHDDRARYAPAVVEGAAVPVAPELRRGRRRLQRVLARGRREPGWCTRTSACPRTTRRSTSSGSASRARSSSSATAARSAASRRSRPSSAGPRDC